MDENDFNLRDLKLTLQITKVISIDKTYSMIEIKKIAKELFLKFNINNDFGYFMNENEVNPLEKINVLTSLNYYKTNEIIIKIRNFNDENNLYYQNIKEEFYTAKDRFEENHNIPFTENNNYINSTSHLTKSNSHRSKETVSNAYNNLETIRKKISELKHTKEDFNSANELINKSEQIIENSKKILKNYKINSSIQNQTKNLETDGNYVSRENYFSNKIRSNSNKKYNQNNYDSSQLCNSKQQFKFNENNYNNYNIDPLNSNFQAINELNNISRNSFQTSRQSNNKKTYFDSPQRVSPIIKNKNDSETMILNQKMFYRNTPSQQECSTMSNQQNNNNDIFQILRKLDAEIKNDGKLNICNISRIIDCIFQEIHLIHNKNLELTSKKDQLKQTLKLAQETIHQLKRDSETNNKKIEFYQKSLEENQGKSILNEETLKNFEYQMMIKEKEISKLNKHILDLREMNESTQKNIKDYEDYTNELNRTIIILKKTTKENEPECQKCNELTEKLVISKKLLDENLLKCEQNSIDINNEKLILTSDLENQKEKYSNLVKENKILLNKIKEINNNINNSQPSLTYPESREIKQNENIYSSLNFEVYNLNSRVNNLTILIEEKDKIIESLKITNSSLNSLLEKKNDNYNEFNVSNDKINPLQVEITKFETENHHLKNENNSYKDKLKLLSNERSNELKSLQIELNSFKEEKEKISHEEINKRDKIIETLKDNMIQLSTEINNLKLSQISIKNYYEIELEKENNLKEQKKKSSEIEINKKDQIIENLKDTIKQLSCELDIIKLKQSSEEKINESQLMEKLRKSLNDEKKKFSFEDQNDKIIEKLQIKIKNLCKKIAKMKRDFEDLEEKLNKVQNEKFILIQKLSNKYESQYIVSNKPRYFSTPHRLPSNEIKNDFTKSFMTPNFESFVNETEEMYSFMKSDKNFNKKLLFENDLAEETMNYPNLYKNLTERKDDARNLDKHRVFSNLMIILTVENEILSNIDRKKIIEEYERENKSLKLKIESIIKEKKKVIEIEETNSKYITQKIENEKFSKENLDLKKKFDKMKLENEFLQKNYEKVKIDLEIANKSIKNQLKVTQKPIILNQSVTVDEFSLSFNNSLGESSNNLNHLKSSLKKSVTIKEGTLYLFTVFDSKRVLKFDIEYRNFKLFEFADFGDFEQNYFPQGSIYLNILEGVVVISGENHDLFFIYNYKKNSMNRVSKLKDNHSHGGLVYYEQENSLICCSGWHNKRVERYLNSEITFNFLSLKNNTKSTNSINKSWTQLPEMNLERSECPFIILNEHYLYSFFGFNCPQMKYLDSIERLDLSNKQGSWEFVKYLNEKHISAFRKSHSAVKLNESEVLFVGGYDGQNEIAIENFSFYNTDKSIFTGTERKFPDIIFNHIYNFQRNNFFVPFIDTKSKLHYASIDERENIHIVEVQSLQYDIFKFED